jgi:phosphorylase kinase alpha/beta subunit
MLDFDVSTEIKRHLDEVRKLQTPTGLFTASAHNVSTGYNKAWLRDAYFMSLGFAYTGEWAVVRVLAKALLQILVKHSEKIEWAITNKPFESWQYIHARYDPETFDEYWEEWGNKQNDAVAEVLYLLCELELNGQSVIETDEERSMPQKLVDYLSRIEYWHDPDSGIWEENQEIHASSVGAVVSALRLAKQVRFVHVPDGLIERGEETLRKLLPRESESKFCDLALLSLIFPFRVVTDEERQKILENVEYFLTRDMGVIRYRNDRYYNKNKVDGYSEEAEWTMGLAWLAIIYAEIGDKEKAVNYLKRAQKTIDPNGKIPELYYSHTTKPNENVPLGWAESMYVVALVKVGKLIGV